MRIQMLVLAAAAALGLTASADAAVLLAWDFGTSNGNVATSAATTVDAGLQSSTLSRGSNMPAGPCTFQPDRGSFTTDTSYSAASLAAAISGNAYFEFAASPQAAGSMSLSSIDFAGWQQNTHSATIEVLYSLDGFATAGTSVGSVTDIHDGWSGAQYSLPLSGVSALQNLAQTATFRLYYYNFGAWEQRGLGQIVGANNDLALNGVVPEPASLGLVTAASSLLLVRRRK